MLPAPPGLNRGILSALVVTLLTIVLGAAVLGGAQALALVATADESNANAQVTFGVQPASKNGPDGRPFFVWGATPGARLSDHVAVVNYGTSPLTLSLNATDALNTDEGGFGLLATSSQPTDVGSWVHLVGVGSAVTIPGRTENGPGTVDVPIQIRVPANASPGDHSGGIVAVLTSVDPNSEGTKVRLEQRVGSRIFVRVAGDVQPALAIENLSASYSGTMNPVGRGSATVNYTLTNTGNVNLGAKTSVTISGLLDDASVASPDVPLLLPGSSVDVSVEVPDVLPQVWMNAEVDVTSAATVSSQVEHPPVVNEQTSFWAIPWTLVALILLLIGLIVGYLWRRRRASAADGHHDSALNARQPEGAAL